MQIAIRTVLATAVELQEMNWFSIDFKATLMSWQQTNVHKHFAVLAWCVSPKSKAPQNLDISTAKYFYRNKQIKKLYCYCDTERVTCRCIKRSYDKWSNSYSIAAVAQQPTFNCWSFFHSVALYPLLALISIYTLEWVFTSTRLSALLVACFVRTAKVYIHTVCVCFG